jgi:hypothetical protein
MIFDEHELVSSKLFQLSMLPDVSLSRAQQTVHPISWDPFQHVWKSVKTRILSASPTGMRMSEFVWYTNQEKDWGQMPQNVGESREKCKGVKGVKVRKSRELTRLLPPQPHPSVRLWSTFLGQKFQGYCFDSRSEFESTTYSLSSLYLSIGTKALPT